MKEPTCEDLAACVEWLIQDGLASNTIKNHISAVKSLFLWWNINSVIDIFDSYRWSLTIRALAYANRDTTDGRTALTLPHLFRLVKACDNDVSLSPVKIALIFGYLGFLRASNLAPPTLTGFDPSRHTTWSDVWPSSSGVVLCLKWTKTLQTTKDRAPIPMPALGSSPICPLKAWTEYKEQLSECQLSPDSPLLLTTSHPKGRMVSASMVRAQLCRAAEMAGLSSCQYTPHSWWRGGASFTYTAGVALEHIKNCGTWKSDAVNAYILSAPHFDTPVARAFAGVLRDVVFE